MPSTTVNGRHILKQHATGYPIPGTTTVYDTSERLDLDNVALNGGVLAKLVILSIDPYLLHSVSPGSPMEQAAETCSSEAYGSDRINGMGIVKVVRSEDPAYKVGEYFTSSLSRARLTSSSDHQEYSVFSKEQLSSLQHLKPENGLPLSVYLGAAGAGARSRFIPSLFKMYQPCIPSGLTAFAGWEEFSNAKKGDTVFVSTAAGAVGSIVVQLAQNQGLKIIGSAGSDDKVKYLKQLGVDVAFNYKTTDTREALEKDGPVDIYWDNVGRDTLDAAVENATSGARVIICGAMSSYNGETTAGVKNLIHVTFKSIVLYGLSYFDIAHKHDAKFKETVIPKLADGTFKYLEDRKFGLDKAPQAILDVQNGANFGKSVIVVGDE
ncbi:NAD(P)-binding protein [Pterulicium gracile]|uniref:NAD(P)-binding protein n=1 Tax=Pterulicium gracile TaxID=1884261 RepID=A0A5C3QIK5_9AGAR|nr:NAD(P)-binding protein [Pterula gracilis]